MAKNGPPMPTRRGSWLMRPAHHLHGFLEMTPLARLLGLALALAGERVLRGLVNGLGAVLLEHLARDHVDLHLGNHGALLMSNSRSRSGWRRSTIQPPSPGSVPRNRPARIVRPPASRRYFDSRAIMNLRVAFAVQYESIPHPFRASAPMSSTSARLCRLAAGLACMIAVAAPALAAPEAKPVAGQQVRFQQGIWAAVPQAGPDGQVRQCALVAPRQRAGKDGPVNTRFAINISRGSGFVFVIHDD